MIYTTAGYVKKFSQMRESVVIICFLNIEPVYLIPKCGIHQSTGYSFQLPMEENASGKAGRVEH